MRGKVRKQIEHQNANVPNSPFKSRHIDMFIFIYLQALGEKKDGVH